MAENNPHSWYHDAHKFCVQVEKVYGIPRHRVAGCLAALSPRLHWALTLRHTLSLVKTGKLATNCGAPFGQAASKALRILKGESPYRLIKGPKTRAFFDNINRPDRSTEVTVDIWALRVYYQREPSKAEIRAIGKHSNYLEVAFWYKQQAKQRGLRPHEFQAEAWLDKRGVPVFQTQLQFDAVDK